MPSVVPASPFSHVGLHMLNCITIFFSHGDQLYPGREKIFSSRGILIAINHLRQKYGATHETLKAIVPRYRAKSRYFETFSQCNFEPEFLSLLRRNHNNMLSLAEWDWVFENNALRTTLYLARVPRRPLK